jgi:hypothetical protein
MQSPRFRRYCNGSYTIRRVLLLCVVLALSACSMVRLAYNHGESLSYWWLDSYVDFNRDQRPLVSDRLDRLFEWHRKTQLRDYIQLLGDAQKRLQQRSDRATVLADFAEFKKRAIIIAEQAAPDMADLAMSLKAQQLANIEKKFANGNDKYRSDYLRGDLAQRQRHRYKNVMEQAEYWFGDFNREQENAIRRALETVPLDNELYMASRLKRQREQLDLLGRIVNEKPPREQVIQMLRDYAVNLLEHPGGAEYGAFIASYYDGMAGVAAVILNMTTPIQKAHAHQKLQQFINDFSLLAAAPG